MSEHDDCVQQRIKDIEARLPRVLPDYAAAPRPPRRFAVAA